MFEREEKLLKKVIVNAYKKVIKKSDFEVNMKGDKDYVTTLDTATEKYIIGEIKKVFPDDNIVSEEYNSTNILKGRSWVIDPIDGTVNFAKNIKEWCIQIAFVCKGKTKLSAIYIPYDNELYFANDKGAWCNKKPISVNKKVSLDNALIAHGQVHKGYDNIKVLVNNLLEKYSDIILRRRDFGSAGKEYAYVAIGRLDAEIIYSDNKWDWMPGAYICEKAGAYTLDIEIKGNKTHAVFATKELKNTYEKVLKDCLKNK